MSAGTEEVAAQKRRGTSAAWLDFGSLPIIMAWVGPDSKLSPSWRGLLFYCGRRGSSPQPHLLVEAPRGNHCSGGGTAAPQACGGVSTQMLGATEVEVEEEWVWREDSKRGSHYCWLRRRLAGLGSAEYDTAARVV